MPHFNPNFDPFNSQQSALNEYMDAHAAILKTVGKRKTIKEPPMQTPDSAVQTAMYLKANFTLGCDPEAFVFNKETNKPVPASLFIPGTKWEPYKVDKGAVQVDGMAAEFNIDPARTAAEWEDHISAVIGQLQGYLPKDHELRWVASVEFDPEIFDAAPDECKELGCSSDFNAWTGEVNPAPIRENPYVSVAGGHVHFGWTKDEDLSDAQHLINCQDLGQQCDFFMGAWGAVLDKDTVRPHMYGRAGAMRYKPYGMEYRTLSNFWVATPELRRAVWNRACAAVNAMADYFMPGRLPNKHNASVREGIVNHKFGPELLGSLTFPVMSLDIGHCRW